MGQREGGNKTEKRLGIARSPTVLSPVYVLAAGITLCTFPGLVVSPVVASARIFPEAVTVFQDPTPASTRSQSPPPPASTVTSQTPQTTGVPTTSTTTLTTPTSLRQNVDSAAESDDSDRWVAGFSALFGAVVGSLLTILGEYLLHRREERRAFRALLGQVKGEVQSIGQVANERSGDGPFTFQPPLPTDAWQVFVGSGLSPRLARREQLIAQLNGFYDAVGRANYLAAQAVLALQIAQTSPDEGVARGFETQAVALSHDPFGSVASKAQPLLDELQHVLPS